MKIKKIIVHCAATPPSMDVGAAQIDAWHKERGWKGIGYHFVITRGGALQYGRAENQEGAHCQGENNDSLGICLVGGVDEHNVPENNFTQEQFARLHELLTNLMHKYNLTKANIYGHRDFNPNKACPSFDVHAWLESY